MDITLRTQDFLKELELLEKIVSRKPSIPVLAHTLIQADETGLRLAATDLEVGLVTFCPAHVALIGTTTLPVKHLLDIVRYLPGEEIRLTKDTAGVHLTSGKYKSRLQVFAAADFPVLPGLKDLSTLELQADKLQDAINKVRFAIAEKNNKHTPDGAMITFLEDGYSLVATDGHRLAVIKTSGTVGTPANALLPSRTLDKLLEILSGTSGPAVLYTSSERHLFFIVDGRMLFSRSIEAKPINYERIIPRDHVHRARLLREPVLTALRRVVLTDKDLRFSFTSGSLVISSKSVELGEAVELVNLSYEGPDFAVNLDGAYLLDFFNAITSEFVDMSWKTAKDAVLFTDTDYVYVQMPRRS